MISILLALAATCVCVFVMVWVVRANLVTEDPKEWKKSALHWTVLQSAAATSSMLVTIGSVLCTVVGLLFTGATTACQTWISPHNMWDHLSFAVPLGVGVPVLVFFVCWGGYYFVWNCDRCKALAQASAKVAPTVAKFAPAPITVAASVLAPALTRAPTPATATAPVTAPAPATVAPPTPAPVTASASVTNTDSVSTTAPAPVTPPAPVPAPATPTAPGTVAASVPAPAPAEPATSSVSVTVGGPAPAPATLAASP